MRASKPASSRAVLAELREWAWTPPGGTRPAVGPLDLRVQAGECVLLTGPSGSGKTTLLLALAGLLDVGAAQGHLVCQARPGRDVGIVFQNVDTQLLCTTPADEVAFGLRNRGLAEAEAQARAAAALAAAGIVPLAHRAVETLSAGEKQRTALAAVLALGPRLLLLDEPTSQLDARGREALRRHLAELRTAGHALVVAEHRPEAFSALADPTVRLGGPEPDAAAAEPCARRSVRTLAAGTRLQADALRVEDPSGEPVLRSASLRLEDGECVALLGANGAGKTTLLRTLVGGVVPAAGRVRVDGLGAPRPERLCGRVGLLFQNPERHFFEETVAQEVAFSLRRLGAHPARVRARVEQILAACGVSELAERSPLRLSFGEQHRVAAAAVLAPSPPVLLLDEPFAGVDPAWRRRLLALLAEASHAGGAAVLIASHDPLPDPAWADRTLVLEKGEVGPG